MTMTKPYRVIESSSRGNRYMVVDDRGEAELGNWFVCSTWWQADADKIARRLNETETGNDSDDRHPIHLMIHCEGATARASFVRDGKTLLWVDLPREGCRRWGETFLDAARRLDIVL